ncbi:amine oxidase [Nonlabens ulvanivorans]|uniref:Amine oxidase n=1 Tax=Nonlabens ulvanivorans TaxID=906888 RepID=A0A090QDX7_NONUL|nr:amine oxidase [Nonlabens ulvanivorans]
MSFMKNKNIIILGAGLCGLTLAYLLRNSNYQITVIEARNRLGGRILTKNTSGETPIDLGPAWLWNQNTNLLNLLKELEIPIHQQFATGNAYYQSMASQPPQLFQLPENQEPSYRMAGGTNSIIKKLSSILSSIDLKLNEPVLNLEENVHLIDVRTSQSTYQADLVVSTIPPGLLVNNIEFTPDLPDSLVNIANNTHTWMADSIKFGLSYDKPFWKEKGLSGSCFSNVGPFTELYDHTNYNENRFALAGFMKPALSDLSSSQRKKVILNQLVDFLGKEALDFISYEEQCWAQEKFTRAQSHYLLSPHQNNGHSVYNHLYFNNKLIISGTETASQYAGYMEGAVRRAQSVFEFIVSSNS